MRDIALVAIFIVLIPAILRRPYIGALAWAWVSMMSPHRLAYGFAFDIPFAMLTAATTLLVVPFTSQRKPFPWNTITVLLIMFVIWMSITAQSAINPDSDAVYWTWKQVLKTQLMLLVTLVLLRGREQIVALVWVIVVSIGYYGTKGGIFTIINGGSFRVWGPADTFIEGNNELALALVTLIPLIYYLIRTSTNAWIRRGLWASMACCIFSILGSHSRGALIAITGMGLFFVLKSDRKFLMGLGFSTILIAALMIMPEEWYGRMQTITTYQEDGSAQSRLNTWATIWNMALDRPLIGGGFRIGSDILYQLYSPGPWVKSFDSHSIYFQALGEHGFPGLFMYLALGITTWRMASRLAKLTQKTEYATWVPLLMSMIQVSIIGFATGGAFLGLLHFDFPYYLAAIVVLVKATIDEDKAMVKPHSLAQSNPLNIRIGGPNSDIKS